MPSLVQPLPVGSLDIIGDVHGEIDALQTLLNHLGYSQEGEHPEGRKLVYLGDLTDRGPDSPATIDLVASQDREVGSELHRQLHLPAGCLQVSRVRIRVR